MSIGKKIVSAAACILGIIGIGFGYYADNIKTMSSQMNTASAGYIYEMNEDCIVTKTHTINDYKGDVNLPSEIKGPNGINIPIVDGRKTKTPIRASAMRNVKRWTGKTGIPTISIDKRGQFSAVRYATPPEKEPNGKIGKPKDVKIVLTNDGKQVFRSWGGVSETDPRVLAQQEASRKAIRDAEIELFGKKAAAKLRRGEPVRISTSSSPFAGPAPFNPDLMPFALTHWNKSEEFQDDYYFGKTSNLDATELN